MTAMDLLPIIVAVALAAAAVGHRRLLRGAQPLRLQMAEKGEYLLAHERVPDDLKGYIEFLLDRAFSMRTEILISMFLLPFFVASVLIRPSTIQKADREMRSLPSEIRVQALEVMRLHDRITAANNPVLYFLFELEMTLIMYPFVALISAVRGINLGVEPRLVKCIVERDADDFLTRHSPKHARAA